MKTQFTVTKHLAQLVKQIVINHEADIDVIRFAATLLPESSLSETDKRTQSAIIIDFEVLTSTDEVYIEIIINGRTETTINFSDQDWLRVCELVNELKRGNIDTFEYQRSMRVIPVYITDGNELGDIINELSSNVPFGIKIDLYDPKCQKFVMCCVSLWLEMRFFYGKSKLDIVSFGTAVDILYSINHLKDDDSGVSAIGYFVDRDEYNGSMTTIKSLSKRVANFIELDGIDTIDNTIRVIFGGVPISDSIIRSFMGSDAFFSVKLMKKLNKDEVYSVIHHLKEIRKDIMEPLDGLLREIRVLLCLLEQCMIEGYTYYQSNIYSEMLVQEFCNSISRSEMKRLHTMLKILESDRLDSSLSVKSISYNIDKRENVWKIIAIIDMLTMKCVLKNNGIWDRTGPYYIKSQVRRAIAFVDVCLTKIKGFSSVSVIGSIVNRIDMKNEFAKEYKEVSRTRTLATDLFPNTALSEGGSAKMIKNVNSLPESVPGSSNLSVDALELPYRYMVQSIENGLTKLDDKFSRFYFKDFKGDHMKKLKYY